MAFAFFILFICAFVALILVLYGISDSLNRIADVLEGDIENEKEEKGEDI